MAASSLANSSLVTVLLELVELLEVDVSDALLVEVDVPLFEGGGPCGGPGGGPPAPLGPPLCCLLDKSDKLMLVASVDPVKLFQRLVAWAVVALAGLSARNWALVRVPSVELDVEVEVSVEVLDTVEVDVPLAEVDSSNGDAPK